MPDEPEVPADLRDRIMGLGRRRGWDGMGGRAVRKSHCRGAVAFAGASLARGTPVPLAISPSALGGVSFQWRAGDLDAYVRVESEGADGCSYRFAVRDGERDEGRGSVEAVAGKLAEFLARVED